jgi:hypothetical protein
MMGTFFVLHGELLSVAHRTKDKGKLHCTLWVFHKPLLMSELLKDRQNEGLPYGGASIAEQGEASCLDQAEEGEKNEDGAGSTLLVPMLSKKEEHPITTCRKVSQKGP